MALPSQCRGLDGRTPRLRVALIGSSPTCVVCVDPAACRIAGWSADALSQKAIEHTGQDASDEDDGVSVGGGGGGT
eukprot:12592734-Alexandrium_andersonii.AAC.1